MEENYAAKLIYDFGINSICLKETRCYKDRIEYITTISSNKSSIVQDIFDRCFLIDIGKLPPSNIATGKLMLAALEVVDSNLEKLSGKIKNLELAITTFDKEIVKLKENKNGKAKGSKHATRKTGSKSRKKT